MKTTWPPPACCASAASCRGSATATPCTREATRLGLDGWVRNRSDGSVEALAAGPAPALDALVAWARRGRPPPGERGELGGCRAPAERVSPRGPTL